MSIQTAFQAQVRWSLPQDENWFSGHSTVFPTVPPAVETGSDFINSVRFAFTGIAGHGDEIAWLTIRTSHTFAFSPPVTGTLTAHTHFMPQGVFALSARKPTWWFDGPGSVTLDIWNRMRVRVFRFTGERPLNYLSPERRLLTTAVRATSVSAATEGDIDVGILEETRSRQFNTVVGPGDTVFIRAYYRVEALAKDGAEFLIDFASAPSFGGEPGDGLNAPMAVINISE